MPQQRKFSTQFSIAVDLDTQQAQYTRPSR